MIEGQTARQSNDEACGFAGVKRWVSGIDGIRMEGVSQGDLEIADRLRAAFAHGHRFFFQAFAVEVKAGFEDRDDLWMMLFRERQKIAEMIAVRVREKNCIELRNLFEGFRAPWVRHDPRINERHLSRRRDERKSAVAKVGDAIAFHVEHGASPEWAPAMGWRFANDGRGTRTRTVLVARMACLPRS